MNREERLCYVKPIAVLKEKVEQQKEFDDRLLIKCDYQRDRVILFMEESGDDSFNMGDILIPKRYMKDVYFDSNDLSVSFPFKSRIYVYNVIHVRHIAYESIVRFTCEVPEYVFKNTVAYGFNYIESYPFQRAINNLLDNELLDIQTPMEDADIYFKTRKPIQ